MRHLPTLLFLLLAGCPPFIWPTQHDGDAENPPNTEGGEGTSVQDPDETDDEPDGTGSREYEVAQQIGMSGAFAWHATDEAVVEWTGPSAWNDTWGLYAPFLKWDLYTDTDDYICAIQITQYDKRPYIGGPWETAFGANAVLGWQMEWEDASVWGLADDCGEKLDPEKWGHSDEELLAKLRQLDLDMAVLDELGPDIEDQVLELADQRGDPSGHYEGVATGLRVSVSYELGSVFETETTGFARGLIAFEQDGDIHASSGGGGGEPTWMSADSLTSGTLPHVVVMLESVQLLDFGQDIGDLLNLAP